MRTSIEIADPLLKRARQVMKRRGVTLRKLVEEGLEHVLEANAPRAGFVLRDAAFKGELGFCDGAAAHDIPRLIAEINGPRLPSDLPPGQIG